MATFPSHAVPKGGIGGPLFWARRLEGYLSKPRQPPPRAPGSHWALKLDTAAIARGSAPRSTPRPEGLGAAVEGERLKGCLGPKMGASVFASPICRGRSLACTVEPGKLG